MLDKDYRDILLALSAEKASFILVGAFAMASHGYVRTTGDLDIWVMPSPANAEAVFRALKRYGAFLHDLTPEDLSKGGIVFQIGVAPRRVDIMTSATGLRYEAALAESVETSIDGIAVRVLSLGDLIANKRAIGRPKDLADVKELKSLRASEKAPKRKRRV